MGDIYELVMYKKEKKVSKIKKNIRRKIDQEIKRKRQ